MSSMEKGEFRTFCREKTKYRNLEMSNKRRNIVVFENANDNISAFVMCRLMKRLISLPNNLQWCICTCHVSFTY